MYLVVGLGNPGREYEATRHNMGFDTIDHLVEDYNVPQGGVKFNAMYGKTMIGGEKVILMKPLSFMNLSGGPVREMANYFKIDPETELIVIYDDIDLEPGQLRIRKQGHRYLTVLFLLRVHLNFQKRKRNPHGKLYSNCRGGFCNRKFCWNFFLQSEI